MRELKCASQIVLNARNSGMISAAAEFKVARYFWNETARLNRLIELPFGDERFLARLESQRKGLVDTLPPRPTNGETSSRMAIPETVNTAWLMALFWRRFYFELNNFVLELQLEVGPYKPSAGMQGPTAGEIYSRNLGFLQSAWKVLPGGNSLDPKAAGLLAEFQRLLVEPLQQKHDEESAEKLFGRLKTLGLGLLDEVRRAYLISQTGFTPVVLPSRLEPDALARLLTTLDNCNDYLRVDCALDQVMREGLSPRDGVVPGSVAVALLRRLADLHPDRFADHSKSLLTGHTSNGFKGLPSRISLLGLIASKIEDHEIIGLLGDSIRKEFFNQANSQESIEKNADVGNMAALTAVYLLVEDNSPAAVPQLCQSLENITARLPNTSSKQVFWQLVLDALAPNISDNNYAGVPRHFFKLVPVYRLIKSNDAISLLWPETPLFRFIEKFLCEDAKEGGTVSSKSVSVAA